MKKVLVFALLLLAAVPGFGSGPKADWKLEKSEITYTVTHPFHVVHGTSTSARGEGTCYPDGTCEFLVAVPVKSFDSGDNNRDLHMQEVTRSGLNPLIKVNVEISGIGRSKAPQKLSADVNIEFAGKKASYPKVKLDLLEWQAGRVHVTGTVPLTLKDFSIPPPALLTVPVHDEVPVKLDMWWTNAIPKVKAGKK